MKSLYIVLACCSLLPSLVIAQSKWGIEFKGSRFNTANSGKLLGDNNTTITEEKDLVTYAQSLGIVYRINDKNLLKLHVGSHQNGRKLSFTTCDDLGNCMTYTDINAVCHYFQFAPSYAYRIFIKRFIIPIEAGVNLNVETDEAQEFGLYVNTTNFDYEFSAGIDYRLDPELIIGAHGLFIGNITEYQQDESDRGTFLPKSIGLEFSIIYEFGKSIDKATE